MKSTFEKMGGTYTLGEDGIYYPNLISTDEEPHYGKYGMMRRTYLKEYRPTIYSLYMLEDRLTEHLNAVDDEAQEKVDILVHQMMEKQGITEEMKAYDQMVWGGLCKQYLECCGRDCVKRIDLQVMKELNKWEKYYLFSFSFKSDFKL